MLELTMYLIVTTIVLSIIIYSSMKLNNSKEFKSFLDRVMDIE